MRVHAGGGGHKYALGHKEDRMFQYIETHLPRPRRVEVRRTLLYSSRCSGDRHPHLTCSWLCEPCLSKDLFESRTGDP